MGFKSAGDDMSKEDANERAIVLDAVRGFVAAIGYPVGAFSHGGLDEKMLVDFVIAQRKEARGRAFVHETFKKAKT